jgi:hypothetical protein
VIESFYDDHHDYLREGDAARRLALRLQGVMAEVEEGARRGTSMGRRPLNQATPLP